MKITFQKKAGKPSLGLAFFWKLTIQTDSPRRISDHFIPELFLDYFYIQKGRVVCLDPHHDAEHSLPQQSLRTIHSHSVTFAFSPPLVLYGARLSLRFVEVFRQANLAANSFLPGQWVREGPKDLDSFAAQVLEYVQRNREPGTPYPMLSRDLEESDWLIHFSPRHKRRLYRSTFGLSRKDLQAIRNVQSFLEQTCDFASQNPRIIQHIDPAVFHDQPHLNHSFRKVTGFSPVEYFQAASILQDNLMSASYNENLTSQRRIQESEQKERNRI